MGEDAPHLFLHPCLRPVGMLGAHSSGLHFTGRPVKAPGRPEPVLAGHGAKDFDLFRTGLFIRQHETTMCRQCHWRKRNAFFHQNTPDACNDRLTSGVFRLIFNGDRRVRSKRKPEIQINSDKKRRRRRLNK